MREFTINLLTITFVIILLLVLIPLEVWNCRRLSKYDQLKIQHDDLKNQYDKCLKEKEQLEKQCENLENSEIMAECEFSEEERNIVLTLFEGINFPDCEDVFKVLKKSKSFTKHYKKLYNIAEEKEGQMKKALSKYRMVLIDYAQEDITIVHITQQRLENMQICCVPLEDISQLQDKDYDYNNVLAIIIFFDNTKLDWIKTRLKIYQRIQVQRATPIRILVCSSKKRPPQIVKLPNNAIWKEQEDCISEVLKK